MNPFKRFFVRITGAGAEITRLRGENRRYENAINAAARGAGSVAWSGIASNKDEDAANKEYLRNLADVLQRSQDLDANNPDLGGFHRTRTAQIVGANVKFKSAPKPKSVNLSIEQVAAIAAEINEIREEHSKTGGFDSTGKNRSEGAQQERALLTMFIHGTCLIHRVWRPENPVLPISLELIPGVRISTPFKRAGDPLISYGIEYSDSSRSRVAAYHVRRVSESRGDSFVTVPEWDRLPIDDCSELSLVESAGMDRSMPLSLRCVRMLRNRGEFIESAVQSARAQSNIYAANECAPGNDAYRAAMDGSDEMRTDNNGRPLNFATLGDVKMIYTAAGEKINWNAAKLPDPDLSGFMGVTDSRLSRGLVSSLSRFTRQVNSSWAGGRLEDQQDIPIVDQYRRSFVTAWEKVNGWFMDAIYLTGAVEIPGYSYLNKNKWNSFRAQFPGQLHINQVDSMVAREKGYLLRTETPQQSCEADGKDLEENLNQWALALQMSRKVEAAHGLEPGELDYLVSTKVISTASGKDVLPDAPVNSDGSGEDTSKPAPINKMGRLKYA